MKELKRFRVSLEKFLPDPSLRNPFAAFRTAESFEGAKCKVLVRTWEFDAIDESHVRRLFDEAKKDGLPQVEGMRIRTIEQIQKVSGRNEGDVSMAQESSAASTDAFEGRFVLRTTAKRNCGASP